jgi:nucleotide-binding universal stress UspA family protein
MAYRTILVEVADDRELEPRLHLARSLADRFDAVLIGMHVMPTPFVPASYGEATAYLGPELLEVQRKANRESAKRIRTVFRTVCGEGARTIWQEAEGDRGQLLAEAAHTTDLVLARHAKAGGADMPDVLDQLVTAAGIPVLGLPTNAPDELGRTVLIGWNGTREAARAVHEALPFLCSAERVVLYAVGKEPARNLEAAAAMLKRQGAAVEAQAIDQPDGDAGEVLLAQAAALGADLLVMGTYGHARLRELVFGGATRHVLRAATLPVLFGS